MVIKHFVSEEQRRESEVGMVEVLLRARCRSIIPNLELLVSHLHLP